MQVAIAEGVKGASGKPPCAPAGAFLCNKSDHYAEIIQPDGIHPPKGCRNAISSDHPDAEDAHGSLPHDAGQPQRCCRR